jgi:hypothetical protein
MMFKKLMVFTIMAASIALSGSYAMARTPVPNSNVALVGANPQWRDWRRDDDRNWRRNNNRIRVERRTQVVRRGWGVYRETYEIRYLPNGRVQTILLDRDRIR